MNTPFQTSIKLENWDLKRIPTVTLRMYTYLPIYFIIIIFTVGLGIIISLNTFVHEKQWYLADLYKAVSLPYPKI